MKILLTNDDGISSRGLYEAKLALDTVGEVAVIAPDSNRSAVGRGITIHRPLTVTEVELRDGSRGFATDGTPVDCVRFGDLGLVGERARPDRGRHQLRRQPGRRRHLLGHGGGGLRGHHPGHPGHRRVPAEP